MCLRKPELFASDAREKSSSANFPSRFESTKNTDQFAPGRSREILFQEGHEKQCRSGIKVERPTFQRGILEEKGQAIPFVPIADIPNLGELQTIEAELAELLAADDVEHLAAAMDPGSTAGVLIWENLWAAPFASAARRSGGQLIANGRIPIQAIIASIEADAATMSEGD